MYIANFEIRGTEEPIIFPKVVKIKHVYRDNKKKVINRFKTKQTRYITIHLRQFSEFQLFTRSVQFLFWSHKPFESPCTDLVTSDAPPQICCSRANCSFYLPVYCCWIVCANHEKFILPKEQLTVVIPMIAAHEHF